MIASEMRKWATSFDRKQIIFFNDFHTFAIDAQLSHISFATSLAEVAHKYRDICEAIAWCLYMYKEFGIFTCILVLLCVCVVGA